MTLRIFHSINYFKNLDAKPAIREEDKINFRFTKPGHDKLLIFDLDETLIHSIQDNCEELTHNTVPLQHVTITNTETGEQFIN